MRVLHLSTTLRGGAGIAASRLNQSLQSVGTESHIYCLTSESMNPATSTKVIERSLYERIHSKSLTYFQSNFVSKPNRPLSILSLESIRYNEIEELDPDVINVHSMYNLLNHSSISRLSNLKYPIVITLHDQRAFTGGCHYSNGCNEFLNSCHDCPQTNTIGKHLVKYVHRTQFNALKEIRNLHVVAPSHWLAKRSKESKILGDFPTSVINNPIPSSTRTRIDSTQSTKIGFIASDLHNPLKNLSSLLLALEKIDRSSEGLELVLIGKGEINTKFKNIKIVNLRSLNQNQIAETITTLHILAVPSLEDNSPNVIGEALMNGTRVIGAITGGIPELLENDQNLLFDPLNIEDIAKTISRNLNNYDKTIVRSRAEEKFSYSAVASKYTELYKSMI